MSNRTSTSTSAHVTASECECQARADAFVAELIGGGAEALTWDSSHHLQGHLHVERCELVVIATRDAAKPPVVLTAAGWDAVRRASAEQRRELIESCAITDHQSLVSALEHDELGMHEAAGTVAA